jgi:hypothetical protein
MVIYGRDRIEDQDETHYHVLCRRKQRRERYTNRKIIDKIGLG